MTADRLSALQTHLLQLSQPSQEFFVLLCGASVIASLGLFENSSATIIGAMIIAPLMRPLSGLAFGTLTANSVLLRSAVLSLLLGSFAGLAVSYSMATLLRSIELTPEILSRTHPTLLDLGVAVAAGGISAYCQADPKLNDSLAGVAIAVALVPPLCVIGIGLANQSYEIASGAALLYSTNLVGITIAAALVFFFLGYSPLSQAGKGLLITSIVLLLLAIPLGYSMHELILENQLSRSIKAILRNETYTFRHARLRDVEVRRFKTPMEVIATVYGTEQDFTSRQLGQVQDFLIKETGIPLVFHLRIIPLKDMTSTETASPVPSFPEPGAAETNGDGLPQ